MVSHRKLRFLNGLYKFENSHWPLKKLGWAPDVRFLICRRQDGEGGGVGGGGGEAHQGDRHTRLQLLHQGHHLLECFQFKSD